MLRGDDVAELQQRLCTLGFDTGRIDGIFGDATVRALGRVPAQRRRAGRRHRGRRPPSASCCASRAATSDQALVSLVREPRRPAGLATHPARPPRRRRRERRAGQCHRCPAAAAHPGRHPGDASSTTPTTSIQAKEANELEVDVFVGLRLNPSTSVVPDRLLVRDATTSPRVGAAWPSWSRARFPGPSASRTRASRACRSRSCARPGCLPSLVEIGPASTVVERAPALAAALSVALGHWADASWD